MNAHAYTEDQLVEQPAIGLFAKLGWTAVSALEETFGATGTLLRETKGEVVLGPRLRAALERLNPALPPKVITGARLFERMIASRRKALISSRFLFELKTSR